MNSRMRNLLINLAALAALGFFFVYLGVWKWMVCRVEVPPGESLLVTYRGPFPPIFTVPQAPEGTLAQVDEKGRPKQVGVLEFMPGPGRHFFSPLEYRYTRVKDTIIEPGKIGVTTSKVGETLPAGQFLADKPTQRGIQRKVLTPGRYRINPYAFDVQVMPIEACVGSTGGVPHVEGDPLLIPAGYVGVVTNKADDPATGAKQGTQDNVLQPGIYFLNPFEKRVDILSVGYNETTLEVETAKGPDGQPLYETPAARTTTVAGQDGPLARDPLYVPDKGITFQANDGFPIHLDFTTIWGVLPDQAAGVIRQFGSQSANERNVLKIVEQNAILPAIESICRINGSRHGAVDLLVGDTREAFQTDTSEELARELERKQLSLLFGLTRHIYIPARIREPIQRGKIANENTKTREQEKLTAQASGELGQAKAKVMLEERRVTAETNKAIAEAIAEGGKQAKEIEATTEKMVAEVDAQTAAVEAQITTTLGEAEAKKVELANQAEAERYKQYVEILGGPQQYNRYVFAEKLPEDLQLGIFYAGPGTFWTDLKGFEQVLLGKAAAEADASKTAPAAPTTRPASSTTSPQ